MMQPEEIERLLLEQLSDARVEVSGDGRHFRAIIVSPDFQGLPRIQRHRLVNRALRAHIDSDTLHAISMRTLTPPEHEQQQKAG